MKTFVRKITALLLAAIVSIGLASAQRGGRPSGNNGGGQRVSSPSSQRAPQRQSSPAPQRQSSSPSSPAPQRAAQRQSAPSSAPQRNTARPMQNNRPAPARVEHHSMHNSPAHHAPAPAPHHGPAPAPHHAPVHHDHRAPVHHHPAPAHHHPAPVAHRPAPAHLHYHPHPVYHRALPARCLPFYVDGITYYYGDGRYYVYDPVYGYEVVGCPTNVFLPYLPAGSRMVTYKGTLYYEYDGMWLLPVEGQYMIVERPVRRSSLTIALPAFRFYATF